MLARMTKNIYAISIPRGLVTALRTLTILPVPGEEAEKPADSLPWFPVVGAILGFCLWLFAVILMELTSWPHGTAIAVVAGGIVLTRGLHLDGLADWADAFWGGWNRERILAIMKDSSLGTFGTLALIAVMLAKWCSVAALVENAKPHWIILAMIISRAVQVDLAAVFDYARPEGGTGAAFVTEATKDQRTPALWTTLVLVLVCGGFAWRPVVAMFLAAGLGRLFGSWSRRKTGGITGDILGAASELTETAVLFLGASMG
jgi:adenosylcobinamide-GDP ribazoletransferase